MKRFCQYIVIITLIFAFALPSVVPAQVGSDSNPMNPLSQFDITSELEGIVDNLAVKISDALKEKIMLEARKLFLEKLAILRADIPNLQHGINKLIFEPQNALVRATVIPIPFPFPLPFPFPRIVIDTRVFAPIVPKIRRGINQANMLTTLGIQISSLLTELENEMRKIADIMAKTPHDATEQLTAIKKVILLKIDQLVKLLEQYRGNLPKDDPNKKTLQETIDSAKATRVYIASLNAQDIGQLIEDIGKIEGQRLQKALDKLKELNQEAKDLDKTDLTDLTEEELEKLLEKIK